MKMDGVVTDQGSTGLVELGIAAHRKELLVFCYRMLGSVDDAEDAVQETAVRAWRAADRYDAGLASVRTWLYRIAANVCMTMSASRRRRALPAAIGAPSDDPLAPLVASTDHDWLQPFPDALVAGDDPAASAVRRGELRLALIAALQLLPARQRAALILREALDASAAEIAVALDTSIAAVNSSLQRARTALGSRPAPTPPDEMVRRFADAYAAAFEAADVDALRELVAADVILEMPPVPLWFVGRDDFAAFMSRVFETRPDRWRMVPLTANGQPAFACYAPGTDGAVPHSLQVFDVAPEGVTRVTVFYDQAMMLRRGIPPTTG